METMKYRQKTFECGLAALSFSFAEVLLRLMKSRAMMTPDTVAWVSPIFTPFKYMTLIEYAEDRQLMPRILNIWT